MRWWDRVFGGKASEGAVARSRSVEVLLAALEDETQYRDAIKRFGAIGARAIPPLTKVLCEGSTSDDLRVRAALALTEIREGGVPALLALVDHPDFEVRSCVVPALVMTATNEAVVRSEINKALYHSEARVQQAAARLLKALESQGHL